MTAASKPTRRTADVADVVRAVPQRFEPNVPLSTLNDWPKNPKDHDVGLIVESIQRNGAYGVVLVQASTRRIIAGHGRKAAFRQLGITRRDVLWLDVDDATAARIVTMENRSVERGGWNEPGLFEYLRDLHDAGNLAGSGYDADDVETIRRAIAFDDSDAAARAAAHEGAPDGGELTPAAPVEDTSEPVVIPPPKKPVSKRGELYELGRHRLYCGDVTHADAVSALLGDVDAVDAIITDPPYCSGGFQEAGKKAGSVGTRGTEMVANDTLSTRGYKALMSAMLANVPAGIAYVFTDWRMWVNLFDVVESKGYGVRNMIVWDKQTPGMGVGWRMQHELIMCGIKTRSPFEPKVAQGNVVPCRRTGNIYHPTEKPVDLIRRVLTVTAKAQRIADPMAGSGTTVLACELTGRTAYAMELTPHYCDVIRQRYADLVGDARYAPRGKLTPTKE